MKRTDPNNNHLILYVSPSHQRWNQAANPGVINQFYDSEQIGEDLLN